MDLSGIVECKYGPALTIRRHPLPYRIELDDAFPNYLLKNLLRPVLESVSNLERKSCLNFMRLRPQSVAALEARYGFEFPHHHDHVEIMFLISGRCLLVLDARAYALEEGKMVVLTPNRVHVDTRDTQHSPYELLTFSFYPGYYTIHAVRYEREKRKGVFKRFGLLMVPSASATSMIETMCRQRLDLAALQEALLYVLYCTVVSVRRKSSESHHPLLQEALAILRNDYLNPPSLSEVAERLHITPNYFSALFQREMGQSFTRYLRDRRFDHALSKLQDPTLRIKEVAHACGFADPLYFCRLFRQQYGTTPSEYRKSAATSAV